jgi:hypothetical protein
VGAELSLRLFDIRETRAEGPIELILILILIIAPPREELL